MKLSAVTIIILPGIFPGHFDPTIAQTLNDYRWTIIDAKADGVKNLDDEVQRKLRVSDKGHIALQLHKYSDNFIRFKDIEIRMVK